MACFGAQNGWFWTSKKGCFWTTFGPLLHTYLTHIWTHFGPFWRPSETPHFRPILRPFGPFWSQEWLKIATFGPVLEPKMGGFGEPKRGAFGPLLHTYLTHIWTHFGPFWRPSETPHFRPILRPFGPFWSQEWLKIATFGPVLRPLLDPFLRLI